MNPNPILTNKLIYFATLHFCGAVKHIEFTFLANNDEEALQIFISKCIENKNAIFAIDRTVLYEPDYHPKIENIKNDFAKWLNDNVSIDNNLVCYGIEKFEISDTYN
jgi:hypothetical protein